MSGSFRLVPPPPPPAEDRPGPREAPLPDVGPTAIDATMSMGELAFAVLRRHSLAMLGNEPGTRLGEDPEALHDMRVATRRLRAALALFRAGLPVRGGRLRRELGWIGRALGEVRDLDVQIEQQGNWLREDGETEVAATEAVLAILRARRDRARRVLLRRLDSRRYARLVESLVAFLRKGPPKRRPDARAPALAAALPRIETRFRKARKTGDRLGKNSPAPEFHRLRILAKRLRYAIEFHRDLYGPPAEKVILDLTELQDLLGLHQDAQVAMAHLKDLAGRRGRRLPPQAAFALGVLAERYAERARDLRRAFPGVWRKVRGKRWKRLAAILKARASAARPAASRRRSPPREPP